MELNNIHLKAFLLFILISVPLVVAAQTVSNDKKLLQGKWVYEIASILDDKRPMSFDLQNAFIKFYGEITIKGDTALLKDEEKIEIIKYEIDGNYLGFKLPSSEEVYIVDWVIAEDKLYMEFDSFHPYDSSKPVKLLLTYSKNKQ